MKKLNYLQGAGIILLLTVVIIAVSGSLATGLLLGALMILNLYSWQLALLADLLRNPRALALMFGFCVMNATAPLYNGHLAIGLPVALVAALFVLRLAQPRPGKSKIPE